MHESYVDFMALNTLYLLTAFLSVVLLFLVHHSFRSCPLQCLGQCNQSIESPRVRRVLILTLGRCVIKRESCKHYQLLFVPAFESVSNPYGN